MPGAPERVLVARGAWLTASNARLMVIAGLESLRLEVNRLWFQYLQLADPARARLFHENLKRGERVAAMTSDEFIRDAVSLERSIPQPQELQHPASNRPQMASTSLHGG